MDGLVSVNFESLPEKIVVDGKTAVLTYTRYGPGIDGFRHDTKLIALILEKKQFKKRSGKEDFKEYNDSVAIFNNTVDEKIIKYCKDKYNFAPSGTVWPGYITVHWVPEGTFYTIIYCADEGESILTVQNTTWTKA